ncbi:glycoside hydrolase family 16 protein [Piscinibacter terrae]|uniref:Glycoside hydrolase family 16 protein n=1 Tax=Piscinibacter terrae TaxID=2496871 RepID=A0A3N7HJG3_9BURK|nr:glycoside hydrolase family 16 protein [Albitalea terrae]RQP22204.1 glycoside hydrolase family 16 protein [Albitalea terrae]
MQHFRAARSAVLGCAMLGSLLAAGCGGGSNAVNDAAISNASAQTDGVARAAAYTVDTTELIQNGLFKDGLNGWKVEDAALVPSELRSNSQALNIGWKTTQTFAPTALIAGRSYTLFVRARNDRAGGTTTLSMRFKRPQYSEVFRTYSATITASTYQDYRIEFTAPAYTAMADMVITTNGARAIVDGVSMKMRSAIPMTEPIANSIGSYVPAGYTLAFNDEFNGNTLNRNKWFTRYIYAGGTQDKLNDEKQRYRDNGNHVVANGVLSLVANKVSSTDPDGINYESGMIRSDWTSRYGYYEARVKMPGGVGVWPAFWLNSDVGTDGRLGWPPEIDIFEFVNNGVEDKLNMLHSNVVNQTGTASALTYTDAAFNTSWSDYVAPFNFNEGWHTVGAQWDPTSVTVYVDGLKIYTRSYQWNYNDGTLAGPAHILLNFAVGGSWAGRHGIDDAAFPQALQIDWVRAYTKN